MEKQRAKISPRLLRTPEAASYVGIGVKTLRQLTVAGKIQFIQLKPPNSPFLYDIRDLDQFIERSKTVCPP